jgi:signal transduction histidine kinase
MGRARAAHARIRTGLHGAHGSPGRPLRRRAAALLALAAFAATARARAETSILVLYDEDRDLPGLSAIHEGLRGGFRAELGDEVVIASESLQLSRFGDPEHDPVVADYLAGKYARQRPDLIVTVMEPSLDFLLRHRPALFAGVPVVFCGVDASSPKRKRKIDGVGGLVLERRFGPTLELALRLQPGTREVVVVGGTSPFDRSIQQVARRDLAPFEPGVEVTWLTELAMPDLLAAVGKLERDRIVVFLTLFLDGAGRPYTPHGTVQRLAAASSVPVYVAVDQYVGLGPVGGHVYTVTAHGRKAAEIGLRVLRGEDPTPIREVDRTSYDGVFDARELERWDLDEARLPPGTRILFRPRSFWDQYKWYVVAGATVVLLEALLIVGLLVNRSARRRASLLARETEARRLEAMEEAQRQRDALAHALRLTTLGELTASFAHEIGQPLAAITSNADAARRMTRAAGAAPEGVDEALADISADALRAGETIRRLRDMFRKQRSERVPIDLTAVIEDVLGLLGADIEERDVFVFFDAEEGLPPVNGDPVQLRQVVINLVVNAEDAIASAGGGPAEIRIETRKLDGDRVAVSVRDSGIGADEADLERIFTPFVSTKPEGLGLGLAITRSIVHSHDGRIWAARNPDRGLTFHVELPALAGP